MLDSKQKYVGLIVHTFMGHWGRVQSMESHEHNKAVKKEEKGRKNRVGKDV